MTGEFRSFEKGITRHYSRIVYAVTQKQDGIIDVKRFYDIDTARHHATREFSSVIRYSLVRDENDINLVKSYMEREVACIS